jgi:hypothetical protein
VATKYEKQEKVSEVFETLVKVTESLDLWSILHPTDKMKEQLAKTYVEVLDVVVRTTEYCAIGRICVILQELL